MNNMILIFYMISLLFNIVRIYNMAMTNHNNNTYYDVYDDNYDLYDNTYNVDSQTYTLHTNTLKLLYSTLDI